MLWSVACHSFAALLKSFRRSWRQPEPSRGQLELPMVLPRNHPNDYWFSMGKCMVWGSHILGNLQLGKGFVLRPQNGNVTGE